jgi:hypothetical protein
VSARPPLSRDEWQVMDQIIKMGGEVTGRTLEVRSRQLGWRFRVSQKLISMQRKGYLTKGLDAGRNVTWRRVMHQEPLLHEMAFGVVGDRYWATCSCGWRRSAFAHNIRQQDEVRERAFQHPVRWPNRTWNQQGPADMTQTRLPRLGSINKP